MTMDTQRSASGAIDTGDESPPTRRLAEERARHILERAAALDAKHSSEVDVEQLREAAVAAGISAEAFEQAMREDADGEAPEASPSGSDVGVTVAPSSVQVAHYAGLLRDLLGEDTQVTVVEDRIEARDGEGVIVSVSPSRGDTTAAVLTEGSLRRRLFAISGWSMIVPLFFAIVVGMEEEEAGIGIFLGALLAVITSLIAAVVSDRKERRELRKKAERIRRQLQRMLGPGKDPA